jgi:protein subunit release factor B
MNRKISPDTDFEISFLKGSGPGGQNRNKRETGVRARDKVTGIVAMATERRSQTQNLHLAIERLYEKLEVYYHVPISRIPTRKTRASVRQRVQDKRRQSTRKQGRSKKIADFD